MGAVVATTIALAGVTTAILLVLATPLAWWLARSQRRWTAPVAALTALPLVLPPTVIGFYLLIALGPESPLMVPLHLVGIRTLAFTFTGLVIGSLIYSLPFAVQPLRAAFAQIDTTVLDAAATLGAGRRQRFGRIVLPLARAGYVGSALLVFTHTLGEFGIVLMIGGSIPGRTEVLSTRIYSLVEALDFAAAHRIAAALTLSSFLALTLILRLQPPAATAR